MRQPRHPAMLLPALVAALLPALPAQSFAQTFNAATIAAVVQTPSYEDQAMLFQAIDAGNLARVQAHVNFVNSFQAASGTPGRINLEFVDTAGNTPLIRAGMQPNTDVVKYLVSQGANINAVNARYESPLIVSYNRGYFNTTRYLLSQGAADPYQVAQHLQQEMLRRQQLAYDSKVAAEHSEVLTNTLYGAAGLAAAGGAVALGVGGGGGSGGSAGGGSGSAPFTEHPENVDPATFNTAEAQLQEGVLNLNADDAYGHGYDGRIFLRNADGTLVDNTADGNVLIAIMDTGVDLTHADLDGNAIAASSVSCDNNSCIAGGGDTDGHGTLVAGVAAAERNGVGMQGIAPNAKFISIGFADIFGNLTFGDVHGIRHAVNNDVQVINGSYGLMEAANDTLTITEISAASLNAYLGANRNGKNYRDEYQNAVTNGTILVYAAGNDGTGQVAVQAGLPYYFQGSTAPAGVNQVDYNTVNPSGWDWSRNWVAVVAVDDNNAITAYSERCGVAMSWCLAAPGNIASSTADGGGYTADIEGTSFAAPNVTGAIAIMLGAFPQLSSDDALQILFETATDLGAAGTDAIYGRGLVNLANATDPSVGNWTLSTSGSSGISSFSFANSGFGLSSAFGNALAVNQSSLMFQDAYRKDYAVPLSAVSGNLQSRKTTLDRYDEFVEPDRMQHAQIGNSTVSFNAEMPSAVDPTQSQGPLGQFSLATSGEVMGKKLAAEAHYGVNLAGAVEHTLPATFTVLASYENPYLRIAGRGAAMATAFNNGKLQSRVIGYSGSADTQDESLGYHFDNDRTVSGAMLETSYKPASNAVITVSNGVMVEKNSMLGSETSGAFGIDGANTYHAGLSGRVGLSDNVALFGQYHHGITQVKAASSSLFTGFDSLETSSFALGAQAQSVHRDGDSLGIVFSQPLRVSSGAANLLLPYDVTASNEVLFSNDRINLGASGRELDFETYYNLHMDAASQLGVSAMLRLDPDNDNGSDADAALMAKYKLGL